MKIKTNHQWRQFVYRYDVPASVLADQFSHLGEESSDGFFCYRGQWYHTSDFMCTDAPNSPLALLGFDGYVSDTYFSGVLIKFANDGVRYQIATFFS